MAVVYEDGGRTVAVQPDTQIVDPIVAWVTSGFRAPGVNAGSGSPGKRPAAVVLGSIEAAGLGIGPVSPTVPPSSWSTIASTKGATVSVAIGVVGVGLAT